MKDYILAFKQYFVMAGRSGRKSCWMFVLMHILVLILTLMIDMIIVQDALGVPFLLTSVYSLFAVIPNFTLFVRRLHDCNCSAWLLLIAFIPLVGGLILSVMLYIIKGTDGPNRYGEDPLKSTDVTL